MKGDWLEQLIADAQNILKNSVISPNSNSIQRDTLEEKCALLLFGYAKSSETRFIEGVYRLTWPLFSWFVAKRSKEIGLKLEDQQVTYRMYGLLCEALLKPGFQFPTDYLFMWCFALLDNLLDLEYHQSSGKKVESANQTFEALYPSNYDIWLRYQDTSDSVRLIDRVIEVLITGDADLSIIEEKVCSLYYSGMGIDSLATNLNITEDYAKSVLKESRLKMLLALYNLESSRLGFIIEEEDQS